MGNLGNKIDMENKVFGRLTVLEEDGRDKHGKVRWRCKCTCGNEKTVTGTYLRNGNTKSCGCFYLESLGNIRRKHGLSRKANSEYEIWKGMKARCHNENHIGYANYGGRGISVCDRWVNSFENFISDMGLKPSPKHSIDRFPYMNGNYTPENSRWATTAQQSRGKRNNRFYTHGERTLVLKDWASYFKVDPSTLSEHLKTKTFDEVALFYAKKNLT